MKSFKISSKKGIKQLYYIYKASLDLGHFPESWKAATIIPMKKPGKSPKDPNSYRPISFLPMMGKIFEKFEALKELIYRINILFDEQCGFRQQYTTTHELIRLTDKIIISLNKRWYTSRFQVNDELSSSRDIAKFCSSCISMTF